MVIIIELIYNALHSQESQRAISVIDIDSLSANCFCANTVFTDAQIVAFISVGVL